MRIRESRGKVSRKTRRGPRGQKLWFNQSGSEVTIWQNYDQDGESWTLGEGTHLAGTAFTNDDISSIDVPAGMRAVLHPNSRTDTAFNSDDAITIDGPATRNLTDFNDQLSEIDVENMGTPDSDDSGSTQAPDITGITEFDWMCYAERYPDLREVFGSDTEALKQHYIDYGASEGRDPYCPDSADQNAMTQSFPEDLSIAYIQDTFGDSSEDAQKIYDYANNYILTNDSWLVSTGNKAQENGRSISQQAMHEARYMLRQSGAIGGSDDDTMIADGMTEQKAGLFSGTTGMIILGIAFVGIGYAIYKRNRGGQV